MKAAAPLLCLLLLLALFTPADATNAFSKRLLKLQAKSSGGASEAAEALVEASAAAVPETTGPTAGAARAGGSAAAAHGAAGGAADKEVLLEETASASARLSATAKLDAEYVKMEKALATGASPSHSLDALFAAMDDVHTSNYNEFIADLHESARHF
jgi:hypothetical protein